MRFDGFINKVDAVTSGTHIKKGDPLMSVFGQDLLNAGVQIIVEEVTGWKGPEQDEATAPGAARSALARRRRPPAFAKIFRSLPRSSRRSSGRAAFPTR